MTKRHYDIFCILTEDAGKEKKWTNFFLQKLLKWRKKTFIILIGFTKNHRKRSRKVTIVF